METKFFLHQIKGNADGTVDKGIVVKATYEAALQGYHAYLGAYAYGQSATTNFVQCMVTDLGSSVLNSEAWIRPEPEAEE